MKNKIKNLILIIIILLFFSVIFAVINLFNDRIIQGVKIGEIDVSNLTENEANEKIENILEKIRQKEIKLIYQDEEYIIKFSDLDITFNTQDAIVQAYSLGRSENIFINNYNIIKTRVKKNTINLEINFNKEFLNNQINSINTSIAGLVEEPSYYIENNNLIITKGKAGIKINNDELLENIEKEILCIDENSKEMEIPVINKEPDEIDIEQIYNEIYREPQDAYITENPLTVHPNVNGVDFEMTLDEVNELLKEEKEEYIIPLKISIAQITVNDLGEDAFPNTLGTFTTRYDATNKNRSNNISLASEKINGTIILPGETFSYNQIVGKRTIEAGYKEAGAYAGGQVVQEVGGGICQVSSTLYNAVLYANLEIVDRSNHYFETSYVDAGRDATVSWGTVDFKFKNNKTYPIKVVAESNNGVCKISILGISEQNDYEVVIQSKQTSIIKKEVKYEEDDTLDEATEIVKQEGHDGCTSETYKILKQNGAEISRELISTDYYHALDKIIIIGTKNEITTEENDNELNVDDEVN